MRYCWISTVYIRQYSCNIQQLINAVHAVDGYKGHRKRFEYFLLNALLLDPSELSIQGNLSEEAGALV